MKKNRNFVQKMIILGVCTGNVLSEKFEEPLSAQNTVIFFAFLGGLAEEMSTITSLDECYVSTLKLFIKGACDLLESCIKRAIFDDSIVENFDKVFQLNLRALCQLNRESTISLRKSFFEVTERLANLSASNEIVKYSISILWKLYECVLNDEKNLFSKKRITPMLLKLLVQETVPRYADIARIAQSMVDLKEDEGEEKEEEEMEGLADDQQ